MVFAQNDHVLDKFSSNSADHSFNLGILPRRSRRGDNLVEAQTGNPSVNSSAIDCVAISE